MKLIRVSIALAAFAALFVMPSIATALSPELTHPTGVTIPPGELIEAENVAHSTTPTEVVLTTPLGKVECTTATFTGEVETNNNGHIAGNITTAEFNGTPGVKPHTSHCKSPFGNITVTPSHSANPLHNGIGSLPWCITANELNDKFTVRGGKCSEIARPVTFTLHTPVGVCAYQKASVVGTYTTHPSDAILTVIDQEFTKVTGSAFCPANGKLDGAFTLRTDTPNDTEPIYIS